MLYVLHHMRKMVAQINGKLMVVFIPNYLMEKMSDAPFELFRASQKNNFDLICLKEGLLKCEDQGVPISIVGDGHISREIHRLIAEKVAEIL